MIILSILWGVLYNKNAITFQESNTGMLLHGKILHRCNTAICIADDSYFFNYGIFNYAPLHNTKGEGNCNMLYTDVSSTALPICILLCFKHRLVYRIIEYVYTVALQELFITWGASI